MDPMFSVYFISYKNNLITLYRELIKYLTKNSVSHLELIF